MTRVGGTGCPEVAASCPCGGRTASHSLTGLQPRREAVAWEIQDCGEGVPVAWGPWCLCPLPIEQPSSGGEPCSLQELAGEAAAVSDLACTAAVVIRHF